MIKAFLSLLLIFCFTMLFSNIVQAQTTTLKRKITDEGGAPVAGATVKFKNKSGGVISGEDGKFTIQSEGKVYCITRLIRRMMSRFYLLKPVAHMAST